MASKEFQFDNSTDAVVVDPFSGANDYPQGANEVDDVNLPSLARRGVVITVPPNTSGKARQLTLSVGLATGLSRELRIVQPVSGGIAVNGSSSADCLVPPLKGATALFTVSISGGYTWSDIEARVSSNFDNYFSMTSTGAGSATEVTFIITALSDNGLKTLKGSTIPASDWRSATITFRFKTGTVGADSSVVATVNVEQGFALSWGYNTPLVVGNGSDVAVGYLMESYSLPAESALSAFFSNFYNDKTAIPASTLTGSSTIALPDATDEDAPNANFVSLVLGDYSTTGLPLSADTLLGQSGFTVRYLSTKGHNNYIDVTFGVICTLFDVGYGGMFSTGVVSDGAAGFSTPADLFYAGSYSVENDEDFQEGKYSLALVGSGSLSDSIRVIDSDGVFSPEGSTGYFARYLYAVLSSAVGESTERDVDLLLPIKTRVVTDYSKAANTGNYSLTIESVEGAGFKVHGFVQPAKSYEKSVDLWLSDYYRYLYGEPNEKGKDVYLNSGYPLSMASGTQGPGRTSLDIVPGLRQLPVYELGPGPRIYTSPSAAIKNKLVELAGGSPDDVTSYLFRVMHTYAFTKGDVDIAEVKGAGLVEGYRLRYSSILGNVIGDSFTDSDGLYPGANVKLDVPNLVSTTGLGGIYEYERGVYISQSNDLDPNFRKYPLVQACVQNNSSGFVRTSPTITVTWSTDSGTPSRDTFRNSSAPSRGNELMYGDSADWSLRNVDSLKVTTQMTANSTSAFYWGDYIGIAAYFYTTGGAPYKFVLFSKDAPDGNAQSVLATDWTDYFHRAATGSTAYQERFNFDISGPQSPGWNIVQQVGLGFNPDGRLPGDSTFFIKFVPQVLSGELRPSIIEKSFNATFKVTGTYTLASAPSSPRSFTSYDPNNRLFNKVSYDYGWIPLASPTDYVTEIKLEFTLVEIAAQ